MDPGDSTEKMKSWNLFFTCLTTMFWSFQDLTVTITSERPDTEIDIIPDENEMSGINVQTFVDQQVSGSHVLTWTSVC